MIFRSKRRSMPGILMLACLVWLAGCASSHTLPKRPLPAVPLIEVDGGSLPAINFVNLVVDIPGGRIIGYRYEGIQYTRTYDYQWDRHFADETETLNDRAREILNEGGYRVDGDDSGALRMVATMGQLGFNSYVNKASFDQAECEMTWELFRDGETEPYFTSQTNGAGRVDLNKPGAIAAAFELALRTLLAEPDFVAAVGGATGS